MFLSKAISYQQTLLLIRLGVGRHVLYLTSTGTTPQPPQKNHRKITHKKEI